VQALSPFGEKLRAWRKRRGLSQLDLSVEAGTTPRYISFVETGRSRPGRDLVLRLAEALQLSLQDRNALLMAAGFPVVYTEHTLDHEALAPVRAIIERVLDKHDPYPAFAFAPGLRLLRANTTAERLFPGMTQLEPTQLVAAWCSPTPGVPEEQGRRDAYQVVEMLRHELAHHPHPDIPALLAQAESMARELGPRPEPSVEDEEVVICSKLVIDDREVRMLGTVLRFDKPTDITVANLRVELLFPADDESERFFRDP